MLRISKTRTCRAALLCDSIRSGAVSSLGWNYALLIFGLTLFLSACLMFTSEFMFAKMVLPLLGGTPAVWNTCVLFFQAVLLAGYAYAHWSASVLSVRRQAFIQAGLVLIPILLLPIRIPNGWMPPHASTPIFWLLRLMLVSVGLPFFAVATTAPVLQRWFARTDHPAAHDPYFLYAASNVGSLTGLIGYLLFIEPRFTLREQSRAWELGYLLLAIMVAVSALLMLRSVRTAPEVTPREREAKTTETRIPTGRWLKWLGLAFVPSSLMLGLTTYATTDVAAVPLLWSIPLAIYLITFIIAFSRRSPLRGRLAVKSLSVLLLIQVLVVQKVGLPTYWELLLHLSTFFTAAMACHQMLANDRPPPRYLTGFYLVMAVGGALGGVFNGLIAPMVFRSITEYPLVLGIACVLCLTHTGTPTQPLNRQDILRLLAIAVIAAAVIGLEDVFGIYYYGLLCAGLSGLLVLMCYPLARKPVAFGTAIAVVLLLSGMNLSDNRRPLYQCRSFFGVIRVQEDRAEGVHELYHGTTIHGSQYTMPGLRRIPTSYYSSDGPVGQAYGVLEARNPRMSVAVIGLGAGALAAYAQKGQSFTFYEIDPAMAQVASNEAYFTYLADARGQGANVRVVLGDGRLTLADAPDGSYDFILLDAFSSDSVPVHLLTGEALGLYLRKLRPGGIIAYNISNRFLNLEPLMADLAADGGLSCVVGNSKWFGAYALTKGRREAVWTLMARNDKDLGKIRYDRRFHLPQRDPGLRVWTDDYSNVLQLLVKPASHPARRTGRSGQ